MPGLTEFNLYDLHGTLDFSVSIDGDRLIIVGENGSGKTTLISSLYLFVTGQWRRLLNVQFGEISATYNNSVYRLRRETIQYLYPNETQASEREYRLLVDYLSESGIPRTPRNLTRYLPYIRSQKELHGDSTLFYSPREDATLEAARKIRDDIQNCLGNRVLYLPTYRRIEQELKSIFPESDVDELLRKKTRGWPTARQTTKYLELVEFGMRDVEHNFARASNQLKEEFHAGLYRLMLTHLGEIVSGRYQEVDLSILQSVPYDAVVNVVEQIDDDLLPEEQKRQLLSTLREILNRPERIGFDKKVTAHFFTNLLELHQQQEKSQQRIRHFVSICNNYLIGKYIEFDPSTFRIDVRLHDKSSTHLELKDLSSGEKQIVSLFSHLLLGGREHFYVLIDEPELSLSVKWQKRFLTDILESGAVDGLIAVTHSPFIFDNILDSCARPIDLFLRYRV